jgi:hypothetical protein
MLMKYVSAVALLIILVPASAFSQGLLSGIRDRFSSGQPEQYTAPAQQQQQVPPPAEQSTQIAQSQQKRPSSGARKLAQELNWDKVPRDLFRRYQGNWSGNFWVYSPLGKKEQVNKIQAEYSVQNDGSMRMITNSYDMISKTWVVQETATYTIQGDTVYVEIRRPNGEVSRQVGHWSDDQLFLQGQINDGVEHFRERVDSNGRLLVDGFGVYGPVKGNDHHIFIGRMTRER